MIGADFDEVDGEVKIPSLKIVKDPDPEKSSGDSGMDEGSSNSGSLDTGENSDDEDIVIAKSKKAKHRILDDDSDVSQDVPSVTVNVLEDDEPPKKDEFTEVIDMKEKRKKELTQEQALDEIFRDSSDESDQEDITPSKKKRVKRPVPDSSSEDDNDENVSLMDAIKKNTKSKSKVKSLEEEKSTGESSDSEEEDNPKRKVPDNLFDDDHSSNSGSSGPDSAGSEVERSDNEQDEGFDESSIDPKLLAKLKKGAAKKPKSARISKREQLQSLHSESQRIVRESRVSLPYHQPAPKSLNDFLERANRKQHEYKVLKGFRDTTKAKVIQDILQKTRIQSKPQTQEDLDKYSDSDEDWNPEEEKEKKLKERVDERIRNKSGDGMPLREIKISVEHDGSESNSVSNDLVENMEEDNGDDLPDIGDSLGENTAENTNIINDLGTGGNKKIADGCSVVRTDSESCMEVESELPDIDENKKELKDKKNCENKNEHLTLEEAYHAACTEEFGDTEKDKATVENTEETPDDMLYDWEKSDAKAVDENVDINTDAGDSVKEGEKDTDENKENIDPNQENSADKSEAVTPSRKEKVASPRSSAKKKRKRIAALAGIDLDNVKPCLSGNADTFISLEDSVQAPVNPGVQKLMDRLSKHAEKRGKKHSKDTDISIISKDVVGVDKEELKLNKFTYHSNEEETNPLTKLETPGAKLVALKEQLQEKMKARREEARQKRQEVYDLDNEEGGYEEEEAEMSEHSDTDVEEEEDFEKEYGEEEDGEEEKEREKNPFADEEAEDDDDDGDDDEADGNNEDDDDEEFNLKLDVSDEENSDKEEDLGEEEDNEEEENLSEEEESVEKVTEFKAPEKPKVAEKPFSMFGRKISESGTDSQLQSAQSKTSTLQMPIEDSQDLYGSMLPQITTTPGVKPTQQSQSQDFSFFLEDSQSNILDADGYLRTKSTGKKLPLAASFGADNIAGTQGNMDELLGLCSGRFVATPAAEKDKSSRKSLFDDSSASNTQGNMDELMGLCSGVFTEKSNSQAEKKGKKRTATEADSDEDSIGVYSDKDEGSDGDNEGDDGNDDEEGDGDTDHVDSDDDERPVKFSGFTEKNKHGKIRQEFVDAEAELSGSEYDSDENLDLAEEDDIMEMEEGDKEAANLDQEELRDEVGRIHLKQLIDDDKRELLRYQEMYLADGDLHGNGAGRIRKFKWSNMGADDSQQDMFNTGSDVEDNQEETDDFMWRKERYEREQFIKEQQEKDNNNDADNSRFLKLGKVFLKKQGSVDSVSVEKITKSQSKDTGAETPGFPGSFYKLSKQKRGSFLARSKEALAKIAEMTKPIVNPSAGAKSSGNFTFQVISPGKEQENETSAKTRQRKAHVPKPAATKTKLPPAKRPKLDTQSSFTQDSIFHHM